MSRRFCRSAAGRLPAYLEFPVKIFTLSHPLRNLGIVLATSAPVLAMAQGTVVADPFSTAITEATTKVGLYAAALVGLSAVAVIFMITMKYVKRIPRAA